MKKLKFNRFEIQNSMLTVTVIGFSAAVMHATFLVFFLIFKVYLLMYVNIFSVAFYLGTSILSLAFDTTKHPVPWMASIFAEISSHAILCTLILGVDTCFFLFPVIALPICAYYLFFYTEKKTFRPAIIIFAILTFLTTGISVGIAEYYGGTLPNTFLVLNRKEKMLIRTINIVFSTVMLYSFTLAFYLKMTELFSRLKKSTEDLQYTATHDALTGLINRRCFWERFDKMAMEDRHYSIAMGDLDSFKSINDTYGHGCGDLVLKSVADIINSKTNEKDEIACRWGGEEMVIVFRDGRESSLKRLEEIRRTIEALDLNYEGTKVRVTMTFGFADCDEIEQAAAESGLDEEHSTSLRLSVESLITMADKRLYVGKKHGKNVVVGKDENS